MNSAYFRRIGRCSVPNIGHQLLHLSLLISRKRQQGQSGRPAVVSVEIGRVLQRWNAEFGTDTRCGIRDPFLFQTSEFRVALLPGGVDFVAGSWGWRGEGQDRTYRARFKGRQQPLSSTSENLKANFFLTGFGVSDYLNGR